MTIGRRFHADWLFVFAVCCVLLASCVVHSRHSPLWVDELYSFDLIQDPSLTHMLGAAGDQADGAPPLYYLLVRPWAAVFGQSELALRLFTSLAFCAAFALLWTLLRQAYAFWPSALASALVVGTSHVIRFENCNVRFYGLLFALIALASLLAILLGRSREPGWPLLAANALAQGALVLCHPLGGFYSAALCTALVAGDWLVWRRWRWRVASSYPVGWLALLLWLRQFLRQADLNRPHSWVPVPGWRDISPVLYGGSDFYPLFVLLVILLAWRVLRSKQESAPDLVSVPAASLSPETTPPVDARRHLLIALAFIALPLALWVFSQLVPSNPLFLGRYVIGVSIGWTIILAQIVTLVFRSWGTMERGWPVAIFVGFIAFCLQSAITEPGPDYRALTGDSDMAFGHSELPIVCLRSHDFLPREHYSPQAERYYYLLDWEVASDPANSRHATVEYKILDALRRNYGGLFHQHIVPAQEFLRTHPVFLVHEVPHTSWVALRLDPAQYTVTRLEPDHSLDYTRDGVWSLLLVERKPAHP